VDPLIVQRLPCTTEKAVFVIATSRSHILVANHFLVRRPYIIVLILIFILSQSFICAGAQNPDVRKSLIGHGEDVVLSLS
jgi:hypothetical protein